MGYNSKYKSSEIEGILDSVGGKQDAISDLETIRDGASKGATAVQPEDISEFITIDDVAAVATSGSYNDLVDKPTIPSAVTESTISRWGFTKNTGTYSKPSGGIPKSDLSSDVQTILNNSLTENDIYDDAFIKANGIVDVEDHFYYLPSEANSDPNFTLATKSELAQKQDTLVSGTNIKTINGESLLGEGDITISGGSSTTPMRYSTPAANIPIPMNTAKVITSVTSTNQTFTLATGSLVTNPASITQEQKWEIVFAINNSLSTAPTITFNTGRVGTIYWVNGVAPTFEVGKFYEVSFLNAGGILLGVCAEFSAAS